jgi:hypothetical protein
MFLMERRFVIVLKNKTCHPFAFSSTSTIMKRGTHERLPLIMPGASGEMPGML